LASGTLQWPMGPLQLRFPWIEPPITPLFSALLSENFSYQAGAKSGGKGDTISWAPNDSEGRKKFQQCHNYFLQFSTLASARPQFSWKIKNRGAKLASCPWCHIISLRLATKFWPESGTRTWDVLKAQEINGRKRH